MDGVPDNVAVPSPSSTRLAQTGRVVPVKDSTSPTSGSDATIEYVYGTSCVAPVTGGLTIVGESLVFATVIVNDCVSVKSPSVTSSTTECVPTSAFPGVPERFAVPLPVPVSVNHAGRVGAVMVSTAPASGSEALIE